MRILTSFFPPWAVALGGPDPFGSVPVDMARTETSEMLLVGEEVNGAAKSLVLGAKLAKLRIRDNGTGSYEEKN